MCHSNIAEAVYIEKFLTVIHHKNDSGGRTLDFFYLEYITLSTWPCASDQLNWSEGWFESNLYPNHVFTSPLLYSRALSFNVKTNNELNKVITDWQTTEYSCVAFNIVQQHKMM